MQNHIKIDPSFFYQNHIFRFRLHFKKNETIFKIIILQNSPKLSTDGITFCSKIIIAETWCVARLLYSIISKLLMCCGRAIRVASTSKNNIAGPWAGCCNVVWSSDYDNFIIVDVRWAGSIAVATKIFITVTLGSVWSWVHPFVLFSISSCWIKVTAKCFFASWTRCINVSSATCWNYLETIDRQCSAPCDTCFTPVVIAFTGCWTYWLWISVRTLCSGLPVVPPTRNEVHTTWTRCLESPPIATGYYRCKS